MIATIMPRHRASITMILHGLGAALRATMERFPALEKLVACGDGLQCRVERESHAALDDWQRDVLQTLALPAAEFSSAPASWIGLGGAIDAGTWLHVDPVHLAVSVDGLALHLVEPFSAMELDRVEPMLRDHCRQAGFSWHRTANGAVFLHHSDKLDVRTVAPAVASRHALRAMQAQGNDASRLIRLSTELQMLLHDSSVQALSGERQSMPINALWLWGAGELCAQRKLALPNAWSNEAYVRGVYRSCAQRCHDAPSSLDGVERSDGDALIVTHAANVLDAERRWFEPLLRAVRAGVWSRAHVYMDDLSFGIDRTQLWRVWRRSRALAEWIE